MIKAIESRDSRESLLSLCEKQTHPFGSIIVRLAVPGLAQMVLAGNESAKYVDKKLKFIQYNYVKNTR